MAVNISVDINIQFGLWYWHTQNEEGKMESLKDRRFPRTIKEIVEWMRS